MDYYKVLNNQKYSEGDFSIVPIRYEDRLDIMKWRNEQIYHLRQEKPLTVEGQENYFNNVVHNLFEQERPNQILFSFLRGEEFVGYGGLVHINWIDKNAEISFLMNTDLERDFYSSFLSNFLTLIEKVAFADLNLFKIYTYAFDVRPQLYPILEQSNFLKEAVLKNHCFYYGSFKDVIIHSKFNIL